MIFANLKLCNKKGIFFIKKIINKKNNKMEIDRKIEKQTNSEVWDKLGFTKDLKGTLNEDISRLYECKTPIKIK